MITTQQLIDFFDMYWPRFVIEWVAMEERDGVFYPVLPMSMLNANEIPDGVMKIQSFNLFSFAIFPRPMGDMITYNEYLKAIEVDK